MNYIGEGGQCKVYEIDKKYVYRQYKNDNKYPVDKKALEVMCYQVGDLKRFVIPIQIDYDENYNMRGSVSKYIDSKEIDLSLISCSEFYNWYSEFKEEVKKLSSFGIKLKDFTTYNMLINELGVFLIDIDSFEYIEDFNQKLLYEQNLNDLNYCFFYGILWRVGQFVTKQSFEETFEEIKNFDGTLYEYLQIKNPYDYKNKESTVHHL